MWSLPGGRVEAAESVVSAVLRELEEETDLEGLCGELVGWVERSGVDHHYVILNFRVTILGDAEPVAGDDAAEARWVSLEEVSGIDLVEGMERFLIEHGVIADGPVLGVL
jgi:ADP-ribose pyrophosphatase YjhB (NUDIX family)